jgi:hypothetical protein
MKYTFYFLVLFLFSTIAYSQSDSIYYYGNENHPANLNISYREYPQTLTPSQADKVKEFVIRESLRYKVAMYRKIFNIDSLFAHPDSLAAFYSNPYILENPYLKGYRYAPILTLKNMQEFPNGEYVTNFFDVRKHDRFIKDSDLHYPADTFLAELYDVSLCKKICDRDFIFTVFYCPPNDTIAMAGGNTFLPTIPGSWDYSEPSAYQYTRPRATQYMAYPEPGLRFSRYTITQWDTIGSIIAKDRQYYCYSIQYWRVAGKSGSRNNKLIIVQKPRPEVGRILNHTSGSGYQMLHEAEEFDHIELIWFRGKWQAGDMVYFPGYKPGYNWYEIRVTVSNNPSNGTDRMPRVRGMTDEEINKIKSDPQLVIFTY